MIDAIVVTHDSALTIESCLRSLSEQDIRPNIIVIDTESTDGTPERVLSMGIDIVRSKNNGFGTACNTGVSCGRNPFVFFLNPDAILVRGSLGRMINSIVALEREGTIAIIGPTFDDQPPEYDENYRIWRYPSGLALRRRILKTPTTVPFRQIDGDTIFEASRLSGAAMLVRRKDFDLLDGFDERFFLYFEDSDFSIRARKNGMTLAVEPRACVKHEGGHSSQRLRDISAIQAESNILFVRKHWGLMASLLLVFDLVITTFIFGLIECARGDAQAALRRTRRLRVIGKAFKL